MLLLEKLIETLIAHLQKQPFRGVLRKRRKYAENLRENTHAEV